MTVELDLRATQTPVHDSLKAILCSAVEAVAARWGEVVSTEGGDLCRGPSLGALPSPQVGMTIARWVVASGEPLVLEDRWQALESTGLDIDAEEMFPLLCVPVRSGGKALGTLQVHVSSLAGEQDLWQKLHVLKLAATSMGCLLEIDKLRQELQRKESYVMRLVKANIDAEEAERERICLEVHDGVTQTLASAFQYLQALENILPSREAQARPMVNRAVALVRQAIQEAREVINSLTPSILGDLGLARTLQQELKQFEKETGCRVEFEAEWPRLSQNTEIALYRIIHEAVTNVRKHANSPKMRIELSCLPDRLVALIKDWGLGFEPRQGETIPTRHSAGLFSMSKRAELLGGTCEVRSVPGRGTEVEVQVPLIE